MFALDAAKYGYVAGGLGEGYLDTFKSVSGFPFWILSGKRMDFATADFPTFYTGLSEFDIVDAVLEIAECDKWVDVRYSASYRKGYL